MTRPPGRGRWLRNQAERGAATKLAVLLAAALALTLLPLAFRGDAGATGGWTAVASMSGPRSGHAAVTLDDGRVLVAGGHAPAAFAGGQVTPLTSTEIYNPATNTWVAGPPITYPRYDASAIKLNDGRVLFTGGYASGAQVLIAELYDPVANTWTSAGAPPNLDVAVFFGVLFTNGDAFVTGRRANGAQHVGASAWFHPTSNTWTAGPDLPLLTALPVTLPDETVLITGYGSENAALVVPPSTIDSTPELPSIREGHRQNVLPDSRVLLAGNAGPSYLYTPSTKTFALAPAIPDERTMHTATNLFNGLVLIAGGHGQYIDPVGWDIYASAHAFDWNANAWPPAGTMTTPRYRHAAAALFDGRVLVTGGNVTDSALTASAEVFDPAAAPTPVPTHTPTSTPTPDGPTATFTPTPAGPTATFTPAAPTSTFTATSTADPNALPDLIITDVSIELVSGGSCSQAPYTLGTRVTLKNDGLVASGEFFFQVNTFGVVHDPGIAAGQSHTWWVPNYETGTTTVTVDSTGLVTESNESNNTYSLPVPIPTPPPTCTPTNTPPPGVTVSVTPTPTHTRTSTPTFTPTSNCCDPPATITPVFPPTATATLVACFVDPDGDSISSCIDNCPSVANANQINTDAMIVLQPDKLYNDMTRAYSDGLGDACDDDDDNDGLSDAAELAGPPCATATGTTNPLASDSDGDRVLDGYECIAGTSPNDPLARPITVCNGTTDADSDGVLDGRELCYYGTSIASADSDGDGCSDAREIASINGDTTVNATDLSQVAQAFGMYPAPPATAPAFRVNFDTNKDGRVTAIDLAFVAQAFGACVA